MKKILIIFLVLLSVEAYSQREVHDTLFYTSVSQDTTVFRVFKRDIAYIELDVSTLADNDTVTIGFSADKSSCIGVTDDFPMKLTRATYRNQVNGVVKYRIGVVGSYWNSKYLAVRIKYAGTPGVVKPCLIWNP